MAVVKEFEAISKSYESFGDRFTTNISTRHLGRACITRRNERFPERDNCHRESEPSTQSRIKKWRVDRANVYERPPLRPSALHVAYNSQMFKDAHQPDAPAFLVYSVSKGLSDRLDASCLLHPRSRCTVENKRSKGDRMSVVYIEL